MVSVVFISGLQGPPKKRKEVVAEQVDIYIEQFKTSYRGSCGCYINITYTCINVHMSYTFCVTGAHVLLGHTHCALLGHTHCVVFHGCMFVAYR